MLFLHVASYEERVPTHQSAPFVLFFAVNPQKVQSSLSDRARWTGRGLIWKGKWVPCLPHPPAWSAGLPGSLQAEKDVLKVYRFAYVLIDVRKGGRGQKSFLHVFLSSLGKNTMGKQEVPVGLGCELTWSHCRAPARYIRI